MIGFGMLWSWLNYFHCQDNLYFSMNIAQIDIVWTGQYCIDKYCMGILYGLDNIVLTNIT